MPERLPPLKREVRNESKEGREIFKATLGFDFLFTKDEKGVLHCYCIEINGHDSGVIGVQDIPQTQIEKTHKLLAGIRATVDPDMRRKYRISNEEKQKMNAGTFQATEEGLKKILAYMDRSMRTQPTFKHAHHNPDFIEDITRDKRLQEKYIPSVYKPRTWHEGDSPVSATGKWVVKQFDSRGGDHVYILRNNEFERFLLRDKEVRDEFVIQEFIPSSGAQMMPESVDKRAAAMRLLMDFIYRADGTIDIDFMTGYQRVSQHDAGSNFDEKGTRLREADKLVVSRHKGAVSVGVSAEEMKLAREAAEAIIQNIATDYRESVKTPEK